MQLFAHLGQVHGDRALLRPDPVVLRRRTRRRAGLATRTLLVPTSIGRRHDPPLHAREVHPPENAVRRHPREGIALHQLRYGQHHLSGPVRVPHRRLIYGILQEFECLSLHFRPCRFFNSPHSFPTRLWIRRETSSYE